MWLIQNPALYRARLYQAIAPIIYFAHRQTTINHSYETLYLQAGKTDPISLRRKMLNLFLFFSDSLMMKYDTSPILDPHDYPSCLPHGQWLGHFRPAVTPISRLR